MRPNRKRRGSEGGGVLEEGERGTSGRVEILRVREGENGMNPQQGGGTMREKDRSIQLLYLKELEYYFVSFLIE